MLFLMHILETSGVVSVRGSWPYAANGLTFTWLLREASFLGRSRLMANGD